MSEKFLPYILLFHLPFGEAAERAEVFDLLLVSQHQVELRMFYPEEVQEVRHEVIDDVCLVALSQSVQVDCCMGETQRKPLKGNKIGKQNWYFVTI